MKQWPLLVLALSGFLCARAADITSLSKALQQGKGAVLAGQFDTTADIALPNTSQQCDEKKAIELLNAFFSNNQPKDFKLLHHAEQPESGFVVGEIQTTSGTTYRVNVSYKAKGNQAIIQSIRIE